ncbi:MAG: hypothetical protein PWR12_401 [Eubacteriaceae bacterium]|nr:hypothetical protein [Eubacteriaceae bacterium]MDK2904325.1 hypothetical protein [Eubacteriaceae bacterium]MDK2936042.1 hypothetical protein [Eubacteriaceae bacterium]
MKRKIFITVLLIFVGISLSACSSNKDSDYFELTSTTRYELLIGLNDSTSGQQIIETDDAVERVKKMILDHTDGLTMTISNGSYYVGALLVDETTINCVIYNSDDAAIRAIVDEINQELNLSVLAGKSNSDYQLLSPDNTIQ